MLRNSEPGPLILIADDSRDVRQSLQKLLEFHGCRVCTAADGQEALDVVARRTPDLILLDIRMPRLDGLSVVATLKSRPDTAHLPVIMLTALSGPEDVLQGLEAGADEFLSKPVDEHELLARVRNLLRSKQQHDRLRDYQFRLARLLAVTEQLRAPRNPQQLIEAVAALAAEHLGFRRVTVDLLDEATGLLRVAAVGGVPDKQAHAELLHTTYRWTDVRTLLRPEYRISESFLIPDEAPAPGRRIARRPTPFVGNQWQPQDNLLVPLRAAGGDLYGLLSFDMPADDLRPGQEQVQLLELFAHQATVALQNVRLYADLHQDYARYVAPGLAAELAGRPAGAGPVGEPAEHDLVVLFADLRGFTTLSDGLSPQTLVNEVLNPYFSRMTEVILAYEGMIDKFLGDGIMALFGLPAARPDDAGRAITAALAMQTALVPLQQEWHARLGRDLGMGAGLARGKAVVGNIGSAQRMDYTAIGAVVNLASRVSDLAPVGQVWATAELKILAEAHMLSHPRAAAAYPLSFRPLLPTTIKGASGTQALYVCMVDAI